MKLSDFPKDKITGTTVKDYFEGKFLLWCKYHAPEKEEDPKSEFMNLLARLGSKHEETVVRKHFPGLKRLEVYTTEQVLTELKKGEKAFTNLPVFSIIEQFMGFPDLLVKKKGESTLGDFYYVVKEIKSRRNLAKSHIMQAAFYNYVLGQLQGYTPEEFYLINRDDEEFAFDYSHYKPKLMEALEEIKEIIKGKKIPPAIDTGYPWKNYAEKLARKKKDITLVQGITESSRDAYFQAGYKTINSIVLASAEDLMKIKGVGLKTAEKVKRSAKAWKTGKPVIFGKPTFKPAGVEIFFDLETAAPDEELGVTESVNYLFGMLVRNDKEVYVPIVAKDLKSEKKAFREFLKFLSQFDDYVLYIYSGYEIKHLERLFKACRTPKQVQEKILGSIVDLLKVVTSSVVFPTLRNGLKDVAKYLGFKWRHDDVTGSESMAMYLEYVNTGDTKILQKIIDYNEDDVVATRVVRDWLGKVNKG
ncbi:MAG: TM0106 family RecB-like putative nuclease [Nanoarchaeota archaeon]|nr:TM0106 family RecB-like putative nuclease [Nanoarchaeota archaeon]